MTQMLLAVRREAGTVATEYAIMVSLIAAVIVIAVAAFGQGVLGLFTSSELLSALLK